MDGRRLADRLAHGAGRAARRVGYEHEVFRPDGPEPPLDPARLVLRAHVAFVLPGGSVGAPSPLGNPYRQAWADWSYLRVGDYLAGPEGVAFIAAIEPPKPMLVVMANATATLVRPAAPVATGLNPYGAILPQTETVLMAGFPASLLVGGMGDRTKVGLPDDSRIPGFVGLVPAVAGVVPAVADLLVNERDERFAIASVERVGGVWRLSLIQAVS